MSVVIAWMAAEADSGAGPWARGQSRIRRREQFEAESERTKAPFEDREGRALSRSKGPDRLPDPLLAHQFPTRTSPLSGYPQAEETAAEAEQERRVYRRRTVAMLRRYLRYSIETGRIPSLLGREFFRSTVTQYSVVTFEDRVIFVHDMEMCLERLDEFSRQIIARHILQEHDQVATARLLHCTDRTVRNYVPIALDLLCEILLEVGLMERIEPDVENSCQGGPEDENSVSDWEDGKNKF